MPLASWYTLHFYGSATAAIVDTENPPFVQFPCKKWQNIRYSVLMDSAQIGLIASHVDTLRSATITALMDSAQIGLLGCTVKKWQRVEIRVDVGAVPSAADAAFAVFSTQFYGRSFMEWQKIMVAALSSKSDGFAGGAGTIHFRDPQDTKNVVTATMDTNGNRTSVTLNP